MGPTMSVVARQRRRQFVRGLGRAAAGLLLGGCVRPTPPIRPRMHRVGFLSFQLQSAIAAGQLGTLTMLTEALGELGYVGGQNLALEPRYADNQEARLPDLATDLARLPVDVIVVDFAGNTATARAARQATDTVPIVSLSIDADVFRAAGLIESVARPGGNVTGISTPGPEIRGKQLELLAQTVPGASRVGLLWDAAAPAIAHHVTATQTAARTLGLHLEDAGVHGLDEVEGAIGRASGAGAQGLFVIPSTFLLGATGNAQVIDLVARHRLPTLFGGGREHAERGGLMCYWRSIPDAVRRGASYVDKLLRGTRPADLPVEGSTRYDFVVNLRTARALGLTIPESILLQATEVLQ